MIPAGESFVSSFADMTRSMMAQSRGLARKVSLAQLLEDANYTNRNGDDKENRNGATNAARNPLHGKVIKDLRSLEAIVSGLERRVAEMRDAIDQERRGNTATRGMSETTRQQTAQLAATSNSLPEHLPFPAPPPTVEAASTAISGSIGPTKFVESEISAQEDSAAREEHACRVAVSEVPAVPILDLVTMVELEKVPRSTRSRLTIAQVNGAVAEIQNTMERRYDFNINNCFRHQHKIIPKKFSLTFRLGMDL